MVSRYTTPLNFHGVTVGAATKYAQIAATFGASAGVFALFFFGEVPRVRNDILRQLPFFDQYFDRTIAPEDNVCTPLLNFSLRSTIHQPYPTRRDFLCTASVPR
ncbi:ubiquinol-cytochrome-c reductase complex subunit-domain-containing protein [Aspergillus flavus]|uniref:Ubiquinol-cytochrome-c reductase complex subunit-domain-containing protein n=1 Tax=Aspergillus flavus (strain ATCC 200026 / FGSC A1120 / IAM 13836 / NRRL 3357 / JCM 12722 / SRRC 167) TaxID=332952 RepID=A0A7U2MXI5_ASPFN|nr:ubiquinol-cytochrome-c reductase complex subunit-domain-containing protein [Aspergillus flavus]